MIALSIFKGRQCEVNIFGYKGWTILFLGGWGLGNFSEHEFFPSRGCARIFFRDCSILSFLWLAVHDFFLYFSCIFFSYLFNPLPLPFKNKMGERDCSLSTSI